MESINPRPGLSRKSVSLETKGVGMVGRLISGCMAHISG
jgi:hypothetical protein